MKELFDLKDQVVVVTGGLGQLGQQFTVSLVQAGAKVAILDVSEKAKVMLPEFEKIIQETHRVKSYLANIIDRSSLESVLKKIQSDLGNPTGLINNAALDSPPNAPHDENGPFENYPEASLRKIFDVNILGTTMTCQVFGGFMAKQGRGSIINISSIYGVVSPVQDIYEYKREGGQDWYKPVAYSVSKSAVLNLTRYLATYWGKKGVRVNTLTPAGIFNNQDDRFLKEYLKRMPMGRMAKPTEMNGAVVFLMSEASSYMTGSNLVIDGGWTAW